MRIIISLILMFAVISQTYAFGCIRPRPLMKGEDPKETTKKWITDAYRFADYIFIGEVVSENVIENNSMGFSQKVDLKVIEVLKGSPEKTISFIESCQYSRVGTQKVYYAKKHPDKAELYNVYSDLNLAESINEIDLINKLRNK